MGSFAWTDQVLTFITGSATGLILVRFYKASSTIGGFIFNLVAIKAFLFGDVRRFVLLLFVTYILVLTIGCTSVVIKDDEIGIRKKDDTFIIKKPNHSMINVMAGTQYCTAELLAARVETNESTISNYEDCRSKFVNSTLFINPFNIYRKIDRKKNRR
jgi:hypothetical protein